MTYCYIINYDLRNQRNYDSLYEAIKSYNTWAHILESCWVVVTTQSAEELRNYLQNHLDSDDGIFVIKSGIEAAWANINCKGEWLQNNL